MLGANLGLLLYRDVSVMNSMTNFLSLFCIKKTRAGVYETLYPQYMYMLAPKDNLEMTEFLQNLIGQSIHHPLLADQGLSP